MPGGLRRRFLSWDHVEPVVYWWAHYTLRFLLLPLFVRWTATGKGNIPRTGAFILVSNHLNNADPPLLAAAVPRRRIRFMAKVELFKPPFGFITRSYGAFPVRRFESDARALLKTERILKSGEPVGMFPEGTRSRTGYLGEMHPGTSMVALRTGVPVIPCAIMGTEALANPLHVILHRSPFTIRIGEPIHFDARRKPAEDEVREATERIRAAIVAMLPAEYLPPYTGTETPPAAGS